MEDEDLKACEDCQVTEDEDDIGEDGLCPDCRWEAKHEAEAIRTERRILHASLL